MTIVSVAEVNAIRFSGDNNTTPAPVLKTGAGVGLKKRAALHFHKFLYLILTAIAGDYFYKINARRQAGNIDLCICFA